MEERISRIITTYSEFMFYPALTFSEFAESIKNIYVRIIAKIFSFIFCLLTGMIWFLPMSIVILALGVVACQNIFTAIICLCLVIGGIMFYIMYMNGDLDDLIEDIKSKNKYKEELRNEK